MIQTITQGRGNNRRTVERPRNGQFSRQLGNYIKDALGIKREQDIGGQAVKPVERRARKPKAKVAAPAHKPVLNPPVDFRVRPA